MNNQIDADQQYRCCQISNLIFQNEKQGLIARMRKRKTIKQDMPAQNISQQSLNYSQASIQHCQLQMCLLHSKIADIICIEDKVMICSKCALFGQHKGHNLENTQQFTERINKLDRSISKMMHTLDTCEQVFCQDQISKYVDEIFNKRKQTEEALIESTFESLFQMIERSRKQIVLKLHQLLNTKRQTVLQTFKSSSNMILSSCYQWKRRATKFKKITNFQSVKSNSRRTSFSARQIEEGAQYFDQKTQQSQILKTAEFLICQIDSHILLAKSKAQNIGQSISFSSKIGKQIRIQSQISSILSNLDIIEKQVEQSILFPTLQSERSSFQELKHLRSQNKSQQVQQEQFNLLDITNQKITQNIQQNQALSSFHKSGNQHGNFRVFTKKHNNNFLNQKNQQKLCNYVKHDIGDQIELKISQNDAFQKYSTDQNQRTGNHGFSKRSSNQNLLCVINKEHFQDNNKTRRSISNKKKLIQSRQKRTAPEIVRKKSPSSDNNKEFENQNGLNLCYKHKKLQVSQKYEKVVQDLRNDRVQIVDFGGAELGDENVRFIIDLLLKCRNIRVLKLVRNKISDDLFPFLLRCCIKIGIVSLNLGQNQLTESSLDVIEKQKQLEQSPLKNITLSLNKINRRNVKERIQEMSRKGVLISI